MFKINILILINIISTGFSETVLPKNRNLVDLSWPYGEKTIRPIGKYNFTMKTSSGYLKLKPDSLNKMWCVKK